MFSVKTDATSPNFKKAIFFFLNEVKSNKKSTQEKVREGLHCATIFQHVL
jgi:hypothetical protein